ncbi:hypothetical protein [Natranaerobius thermophilus]|uniref:Lipoprotein n=1 Tax=Natranaerobius thermophilus (strain ATCC BAA-1301 / DSM 18059 / JW/NM-WN-LF) TaxID=457570 RepID=B2A4T8_NATTJ|nr:hypothetical protein [Natranaerobius thermophilus]ACB83860.1 hypothetical protein Nther_0262 [Natranaerobius thermophilus JW/NM-WN-LF]
MSNTKRLLTIFVILAITIVISSCNEQEELEIEDDLLTKSKILEVLEEEYELEEIEAKSPVDELKEESNMIDASYQFDDLPGELFIYIFESIEERNEHFSHEFSYTRPLEEEQGVDYSAYNAQNAAIVYRPLDQENVLGQTAQLSEIILYQLNDINETSYKGEGENWQVELNASYYDYELETEDENDIFGLLTYEIYYKGDNHDEVIDMMLYFPHSDGQGKAGGGRGAGEPFLEKGEPVKLDFSGKTLPDGLGNDQTEVIIEWEEDSEQLEEVITLGKE